MSPRLRLAVAAALFLGWLGWLGYAAAVKSRAPIVSRAQAAVAGSFVVAHVRAQAEGKPASRVKVGEVLHGKELAPGAEIDVANLPDAHGFDGDGDYLLLLRDPSAGGFSVVGQQRSPGYELAGAGKPLIYRWSEDVKGQVMKLLP